MSEISRNTKAANLVSSQLVWLAASRNLDQAGGDLGTQSRSNCGAGGTPRSVAVEQQYDFFEVVLKKPLLMRRKGAPHEGDNTGQTCLMNGEAIEEAFDNHYAFAMNRGPLCLHWRSMSNRLRKERK